MNDFLKVGVVLILLIGISLTFSQTGITGKVIEDSRPLISCGTKIDHSFPETVILSPEDPITKEGCSNGDGIKVQQNYLTLDCDGYTIKSSTGRFSGILIKSGVGVTVKNCNIKGFDSGIDIYHGSKNIVKDNNLNGLASAIKIRGNSGDNEVTNNLLKGVLGIEWNTNRGNNKIFGNDFYTNETMNNPTQVETTFCLNGKGNYLSPITVDVGNIKELCGKSESPFLT